jgi:hypothetical protein
MGFAFFRSYPGPQLDPLAQIAGDLDRPMVRCGWKAGPYFATRRKDPMRHILPDAASFTRRTHSNIMGRLQIDPASSPVSRKAASEEKAIEV